MNAQTECTRPLNEITTSVPLYEGKLPDDPIPVPPPVSWESAISSNYHIVYHVHVMSCLCHMIYISLVILS